MGSLLAQRDFGRFGELDLDLGMGLLVGWRVGDLVSFFGAFVEVFSDFKEVLAR